MSDSTDLPARGRRREERPEKDDTQTADVTPRIADIYPITMSCDYQLPWNRQSNQTACGRTIQTQVGDKNWRIVIEGVITLSDFQRLNELRGADSVTIRTAELGTVDVKFDQLNATRTNENAVADFDDPYTSDLAQPLVEFQLQSKQDSESEQDPPVEFVNE